ncbi:hypothetical protein H0H87_010941 [Tephrocybe sp. NHM501043]|nr:hypothetical protein H0H87_010941 [Tephrocybe sp. NHM501043]
MVQLLNKGREEIQRILSDAVEDRRTSGLVFGATSVEEELFFAHAGLRVFDDPSSGPMTEDSILWICSQTKMIASIAAFQLIEAGKLSLDTEVADILPELANAVVVGRTATGEVDIKAPKSPITVRHLLNHTSGLDYGPETDRICEHYMPVPYATYQEKLNPVKHFFDQRKDKIFSPLGITAASFYLTPDLKENAVLMSYREPNGTIVPWDDQVPIIVQDPKKGNL